MPGPIKHHTIYVITHTPLILMAIPMFRSLTVDMSTIIIKDTSTGHTDPLPGGASAFWHNDLNSALWIFWFLHGTQPLLLF